MSHWHCTVTRNATDVRYSCEHQERTPRPSTERYCVTLPVASHVTYRPQAMASRLANSLFEAKWPAEACTMFRQAYVLACQRLQAP